MGFLEFSYTFPLNTIMAIAISLKRKTTIYNNILHRNFTSYSLFLFALAQLRNKLHLLHKTTHA